MMILEELPNDLTTDLALLLITVAIWGLGLWYLQRKA
jgi:hypothetical protein